MTTQNNEAKSFDYYQEMLESTDYLAMDQLQDRYCYKVFARNAYVGVWIEEENAFMISRYKVGENPYLCHENHWDTHDEENFPFGTAKPLELIEEFPFEIKIRGVHEPEKEQEILNYLDQLEENNPINEWVETPHQRKQAAINFEQRLSGNRTEETRQIVKQARELGIPVHELDSIRKINRVSIKFIHDYGRDATLDELVSILEIAEEKLVNLLKIKKTFSL